MGRHSPDQEIKPPCEALFLFHLLAGAVHFIRMLLCLPRMLGRLLRMLARGVVVVAAVLHRRIAVRLRGILVLLGCLVVHFL